MTTMRQHDLQGERIQRGSLELRNDLFDCIALSDEIYLHFYRNCTKISTLCHCLGPAMECLMAEANQILMYCMIDFVDEVFL